MRTAKCRSGFVCLLVGAALAYYSAKLPAAPAVLLEKAKLVPSDGASEGGFGRSIAINGTVAVVTANEQQATLGSGPDRPSAAYVFERQATGAWIQTAKLSSGNAGDLYGIDVAVDGNVIVVGAVFSGLSYVYEKVSGSWQQTAVLGSQPNDGNGYSVAIENGIIAIGEGYSSHGMALFQRQTSGWVQIASYDSGIGQADDEYYSPRVDISPNFAIHGSWGWDSDPPVPSTAYIYKPAAGGNWAQATVTALTQPNGPASPNGWSRNVMITANTALISGDVFRFENNQWHFEASVPGATALDDDSVTLLGFAGPYRYTQLHRRTTAQDAWPTRAELAASDEAPITSASTDAGRTLLASYGRPSAYVYDVPSNLDRNELVQDDFQDGDAAGWSTLPGSTFAVAASGASRFYRQTNTTGNAAALWPALYGSNDQSIQADITPRAFDGADRWFGLVTRYTDADNYYYVTARSGGGIQLKRMQGGAFTTLGSAALPVAIGTTHRIRLESVGDHVRVFVNNRPVIRVRDAALSGGQPGLMMYRTQADYDNIVANSNPALTALVDDFELLNFDFQAVAGSWSRFNTGTTWVRRQSDVTGGTRLVTGGLGTMGDQIVAADLRPTQFSGTDRWVGLIARYRDDSNYHYVTLRNSGSLDIKKLVNGAIQNLVTVPFTVQPNVSYRVRLEVIGTRVRAYVNDTLRAEATDASLTPVVSRAGVATYKAALDLDNFLISQP
ncbi:FG-GAP repeat protein [Steroidobacter flavus]|uniref:FG-GAP repeat protein n=1 Tax=Steroidobacter flavus TaxID=1842136 RepID=A0ABV8T181_9GAMM